MGITVKGLFEYAEICLDGEMYQELNSVLNIAFNIASAWDLNEIDEIQDSCEAYRNRAKAQIKEDIEKIEKEAARLTELKAMYSTL